MEAWYNKQKTLIILRAWTSRRQLVLFRLTVFFKKVMKICPTTHKLPRSPVIKQEHCTDAMQYIEGEPFISTVPVGPGITNVVTEKNGQYFT